MKELKCSVLGSAILKIQNVSSVSAHTCILMYVRMAVPLAAEQKSAHYLLAVRNKETHMSINKLAVIAVMLVLALPALAADDGQTQPRLNYGDRSSANMSIDIVTTTNGSGNVKGVQCIFANGLNGTLNIYINGGSAQSLALVGSEYPVDFNGANHSGWIPLNLRFTSSIRVQLQKGSGTGLIGCWVSWALD